DGAAGCAQRTGRALGPAHGASRRCARQLSRTRPRARAPRDARGLGDARSRASGAPAQGEARSRRRLTALCLRNRSPRSLPCGGRLAGVSSVKEIAAMFEARFQSFEDKAERAASGPRVAALRTELARRGLTGFIVPRSDRHQNEYVPASEQRLAWLT